MNNLPTSVAELEVLFRATDPDLPYEALSEHELAVMDAYDAALNVAAIKDEAEALAELLPSDPVQLSELYNERDRTKPERNYTEREKNIAEAYREATEVFGRNEQLLVEQEEAEIECWARLNFPGCGGGLTTIP